MGTTVPPCTWDHRFTGITVIASISAITGHFIDSSAKSPLDFLAWRTGLNVALCEQPATLVARVTAFSANPYFFGAAESAGVNVDLVFGEGG
jgi:hypothetical protein